jgi:signal transduction histidine kinase
MDRSHTILVIDDEPDVVRSVKDLLRLDYNVIATTNPAEAMDRLGRGGIHVAMTDQRMPGMTGVQLLTEIRNQYPEIIRLLFTGYADMKAVIDAVNQGQIYRYITKPWDADELQLIIREACSQYDLLAERKQLMHDLERTNTELQKSDELKAAFIKVAGHEFRTPVALLSGFSRLALQASDVSESLREHLLQIESAAGRLRRLMNQILTMLSSERFEGLCQKKPEDLESVLKQAIEDIRPFADRRKQVLEIKIMGELGSVDIDAEKIRDCVNQLLLNSVKFSNDGDTIHLKAWRDDTSASIEIKDRGCGIESESLSRIFDPFFTGFDVSHHRSGEYEHGAQGLGLGLCIVKTFTELHGGKVSVRSEPGKGSTFTICIPVSAVSLPETAAA